MSVAVIVLCYNHQKFLPDLFDSIDANKDDIDEVFLIDNASSDNTIKCLRDFSKKKIANIQINVVRYEKPLHVAAALNNAIKNVKSAYVSFIAGDDFLLNNRFVKQLQVLNKDLQIPFVYSNGLISTEEGKLTSIPVFSNKTIQSLRKTPVALKQSLYYSAPGLFIQCALYKVETLFSIGLFDEDLIIEDWPFHIKLFEKYGGISIFLDEYIVAYRRHGINASKIPYRQYLGQKQILYKFSKGILLRKGLYILFMRQALYFLSKGQMFRFKFFLRKALKQSPGYIFSANFILMEFKSRWRRIIKVQE